MAKKAVLGLYFCVFYNISISLWWYFVKNFAKMGVKMGVKSSDVLN
jgi:hypothetical protein